MGRQGLPLTTEFQLMFNKKKAKSEESGPLDSSGSVNHLKS